MDLTNEELDRLKETIKKLNSGDDGVTYSLVEIKGTYFIHPKFPSDE